MRNEWKQIMLMVTMMEGVSADDDVDGKAMVVEGEWMSSIT